jgi:outer membrane lipoprotein-sorting protein
LYLWQIRHIPNTWRNLSGIPAKIAFSFTVGWMVCLGLQTVLGQAPSANPPSENKKTTDPAVAKAATEFMKKLHESLYARTAIKADVEQTVSIGTQQFQISGHYLSSGEKLRLEYTIQPDQGVAGSLLEICDGKELWSMMKIAETTRVTHRDVQQIKAAVAGLRSTPDVVLTAELGLGGITALLASLERTMTFDAMKEESTDDGPRMVVQGRWKPEIAARWPRNKDDLLPTYIPDLVRVWVDPQTMFPVRISYIKRVLEKDKKVYRPMVTLKFKDVEFDTPVNDQDFTFVLPENIAPPEDITRQFLDRMKKSADDGANAAKAAQPAPAAPAQR